MFNKFARLCHGLDVATADEGAPSKGSHWLESGHGNSGYNHTLPPNDNTCKNNGFMYHGAWTAGSWHPGGAHVLFADGHVAFQKDSISWPTWVSAAPPATLTATLNRNRLSAYASSRPSMKLLLWKPSNRSRNSPRTLSHDGMTSFARLKMGAGGADGRGGAGGVIGEGLCVACGADAVSAGTPTCAAAIVDTAMKIAASSTGSAGTRPG